MDWVMTELLAYSPLWIANNQCNSVVSIHQDFGGKHEQHLLTLQMDGGLIYWAKIFRKTQLSNQKEEDEGHRQDRHKIFRLLMFGLLHRLLNIFRCYVTV
jgi:hypothetical protein